MERDTETTADDLQRPEGNDLKTNYKKHDIAEGEFLRRIDQSPFEAVEWGIDMREDDGEDGVIYDDKLDFKVFDEDGNLVGLVDVKAKSNPKYMGTYNERHYVKYHGQSKEHDVPAFVLMFQVDWDENVIHDEFVQIIDGKRLPFEDVISSTNSSAVDNFPDGNNAVLVPHHRRFEVGDMFEQFTIKSMEKQ